MFFSALYGEKDKGRRKKRRPLSLIGKRLDKLPGSTGRGSTVISPARCGNKFWRLRDKRHNTAVQKGKRRKRYTRKTAVCLPFENPPLALRLFFIMERCSQYVLFFNPV